jgi:hypothetical protein
VDRLKTLGKAAGLRGLRPALQDSPFRRMAFPGTKTINASRMLALRNSRRTSLRD